MFIVSNANARNVHFRSRYWFLLSRIIPAETLGAGKPEVSLHIAMRYTDFASDQTVVVSVVANVPGIRINPVDTAARADINPAQIVFRNR
jgi:hypothetical protein